MGKDMKIDSKHEKYVQSENGLRIEGKQDIYEGKHWVKTYTWMRYVDSTKTMDDLKK